MPKYAITLVLLTVLGLLLACSPGSLATTPALPEFSSPPAAQETAAKGSLADYLTPNPVETSTPVYGATINVGHWIARTFDGHQKAGYGPQIQLPVFNQLVMFDTSYKEAVPETIIGDLAERWETSLDGKEITFYLRKGVKWHDGVAFTADDVAYSLDKMNDVNHSAISDWFPAYESSEKIDEYTVKVHLKYPSAGFLLALAQGESQIQAFHLAGTNDQSATFMVGTGPFILTDFLPGVNIKYKRNPEYWKKDKYGNQLPYLDGINYYHLPSENVINSLISRRLDMSSTMQGASNIDTYNRYLQGAPDLLWQTRYRYNGTILFLNMKNKPLDDIRVRWAMGLVINQEDLLLGATGDVRFGLPGAGLLHPSFGLPKEEVTKLMGWDKSYDERVTEAQKLLAEAGYPDGFKLNMLSYTARGADHVFADVLRRNLKIDVELATMLGDIEINKRVQENWHGIYTHTLDISDPLQLSIYFGTSGYANYANYSNSELDKILADLDHIIDPGKRHEAIWSIERILLTDLPALPTGHFAPTFMPYYPHVKNLRWNYMSYSNINRFEDVWIDQELKAKIGAS